MILIAEERYFEFETYMNVHTLWDAPPEPEAYAEQASWCKAAVSTDMIGLAGMKET